MSTKFQREKEALQKIAKKTEGGTDGLLIRLADYKYTTPVLLGILVCLFGLSIWLTFG